MGLLFMTGIKVLDWTDDVVEQNMQAVKDVVHAARSLKTQYDLPNSVS